MKLTVIKNDNPDKRIEITGYLYTFMSNAIRNARAKEAKEWLLSKRLTAKGTGACYNSKSVHLNIPLYSREELEAIGFLSRAKVVSCTAERTYRPFATNSVMFPLRNEKDEVVNFYAIRLKKDEALYWNEEGIYPGYPKENTKRIYVVDEIIEAATLLESKVLGEGEAVMALYEGRILAQHRQAIERVKNLQDVIVIKTPQTKTNDEQHK